MYFALILFSKPVLISRQIHTAKELVTDWLQLISELSHQRDKLAELASSQNESEWRKELDTAQNLKVDSSSINVICRFLFTSFSITNYITCKCRSLIGYDSQDLFSCLDNE